MPLETTAYDSADYLTSDEAQAEYLSLAFESGDDAIVRKSLSTVARARGMAGVAKDADVSRQGLYKCLSETGDPKLSTLMGVLKALGMQMVVQPAAH